MKNRTEYSKKYYKRNKEMLLGKSRRYLQTASGVYSGLKGALKKRSELNKLKISRDDFIDWYNSVEKICSYCKRTSKESAKDYQSGKPNSPRLSIDRIDNKKGYEKGNMVLACMRCNRIKNDFFTKDEMLKIVELFPYKFY